MLKKRKRLKSLIIVFVVIIIIIGCVVIAYNQFIKSKEENAYSTQLDLKNISELAKNQLKDIKNKIKENKAESLKEETNEQEIIENNNSNNSSSNSSNNSSNIQNNTNTNTFKNDNKQSPPTHNNNSSSENQSKPPIEQTPSCTPKKFYTTFRADFSSEAECEAKYNYYHNIDPNKYLGFICSYQTDDCGVTYYMLTFFDSNGHYFGYNEI